MKVIPFPLNDREMVFEYHKVREGPNWFLCYYKNASFMRELPLDAWRTLGIAKNTDTGKALKAWCLEVYQEHKDYGVPAELKEAKSDFFEAPNEAE